MVQLGDQTTATIEHCDPAKLLDHNGFMHTLRRAIEHGRLNEVTAHYEVFDGGGLTAVFILSQSHLTAHTWPEFGALVLDLFECTGRTSAEAVFQDVSRGVYGVVTSLAQHSHRVETSTPQSNK